jgi:hypothetical protein
MTILIINTGTSANAGNGDSLRGAFQKINANFAYLSTLTNTGGGGGSGTNVSIGHFSFVNNIISTTGTNEDIILDPNGSAKVRFPNTPIQFDNGGTGNIGQESQILYTKGGGAKVGLGLDGSNSSLRIVGDAVSLGTLVDMGLYNGVANAWASKVLIDYLGNVTAKGTVIAQGGIRFGDGSIQNSSNPRLTISYITSATVVSNIINNVTALRFDTDSGFSLTDLGSGAVQVAMNSTFKYWEVAGQSTLVAEGLDHVTFIAGTGMTIATNTGTNPKSITFSSSGGGGASLANITATNTTLYPSTNTNSINISNAYTNASASSINIPALTDTITPLVITSPNEVRITTKAGSTNPITISPNIDGTGPGYVVIGNTNSTSTAGLFAFSAAAGVNFWPNLTIAKLTAGANAGTLDMYTTGNNSISMRPGGTGTVVVVSTLTVQGSVSATVDVSAQQRILFSVNAAGVGRSATSATYITSATTLVVTKQVHKLTSIDYYLPPGTEGQIVYFVPTTGAGTSIRIWFQRWRSMSSGTATEIVGTAWYPFSATTGGFIPVYAIYTDGAWTTSHGYTS